ncbi:MAG: acyltransferase, partial [Dysgonamonadaceae bacterium]
GRVYFKFGEGINRKLDQLDPSLPKSSLLEAVAGIIDAEIYKNYILFPFNYVAYDTMTNSTMFQSEYTLEDKEAFEAYVAKQLDKIQLKHKDWDFLREKIVEMYGNPVKNFLMVQPTS